MRALKHPALSLAVLSLLACNVQPPASSADTADTGAAPVVATSATSDEALIAHGEYLARIAGCNDCHTPGFPEAGGELPTEQWLMGSSLGMHGPWGTTYPANLRLKLQDMDEAAWMDYSGKLHTRPPMPDFGVRAMTEHDRLSLYRFIKSLGPAGEAAPDYLPPGQQPPVPYLDWVLPPPPPEAAG